MYFAAITAGFLKSSVSQAVTQYFSSFASKVNMLLKTDSVANTQNNIFVDNSSNNSLITASSAVTQGSNSPYSTNGWSAYFNGTTDCINVASSSQLDLSAASTEFTVEGWYNFTAIGRQNGLFGMRHVGTSDGWGMYTNTANFLYLLVLSNGVWSNTSIGGPALAANTWYHIALVRTTTSYCVYLNGVKYGTSVSGTYGMQFTNTTFCIGSTASTLENPLAGYISNFRIVTGTALYTTAFTPPTAPLTAIAGTVLLCLQDALLKDNSVNAAVPFVTGAPTFPLDNPFTPSAAYDSELSVGSALFTSGGTLSAPANSGFLFPGNFTAECWFNANSVTVAGSLFGNYTTSALTDWLIDISAAGMLCVYLNGTTVRISTAVTAKVWHHVAIVRSGSVVTGYLDGVSFGTYTTAVSMGSSAKPINIGSQSSSIEFFNGVISNVRIVKNVAVYTANFTPEIADLTPVTGTSLLCLTHLGFKDISTNYGVITKAGTVSPVPDNPFGVKYTSKDGSAYFTGGNYLLVPYATVTPTADFTLEMFCKPASNAVSYKNIWRQNTTAYSPIVVNLDSTNKLAVSVANTAGNGWAFAITGAVVPVNSWTHIALVRSGNVWTIYQNGVSTATITLAVTLMPSTLPIIIGAAVGGSQFSFDGYLSNLRLVLGTAVYTTAFTPPTAAVTAITGTALLLNFGYAGILDVTTRQDLTLIGSTTVNTSIVKYNSGSIALNGTTDYVSGVLSKALGTDDFTVEAWIFPTTMAWQQTIFATSTSTSSSTAFSLYFSSGGSLIYFLTGGSLTSAAGVIVINTWQHVAMVRSSGTISLFVNGIVVCKLADASNYSTTTFSVGAFVGGGVYFKGYIEDLRVTNSAVYSSTFTPSITTLPTITDPYFGSVSLLLDGEGLNGGNNGTFVDSSSNAATITRLGFASQGTMSPFNTSGLGAYFNGTTDYLTLPASANFAFTTTDFTTEFFVYRMSPTSNTIFDFRTANSATATVVTIGVNGTVNIYDGPSGVTLSSRIKVPVCVYTHVAIVRISGMSYVYVNGVKDVIGIPTPSSYGATSQPCMIGNSWLAGNNLTGYLSNVRITKSAVYTTDFIVPTGNLPALANTVLLCLQSPDFVDNSTNNAVITRVGLPVVKPFGPFTLTDYSASVNSGSGLFTLAGDYLNIPSSSALSAPNDFTWECWLQLSSSILGTNPNLYQKGRTGTANLEWGVYLAGQGADYAQLQVAYSTTGSDTSNTNSTSFYLYPGIWTHLAISKVGTNIYFFVNGKAYGAITSPASSYSGAGTVSVGNNNTGTNTNFIGAMSNLRVVKGTGLYTTAFTPPTSPVAEIAGTALLLNFTNGNILDKTGRADVKVGGNVVTSTTQKKFGTSSLYFDGAPSSLAVTPISASVSGTSDFTVEFWMYPSTMASGYRVVFSNDTSGGLGINLNSNGTIAFGRALVSVDGTTVNTVTFNAWNNIVVRRASGVLQVSINGVVGYSAANVTSFTAGPIRIGTDTGGSNYPYIGYLDDIRVTQGKGRYSVEPTAALTM